MHLTTKQTREAYEVLAPSYASRNRERHPCIEALLHELESGLHDSSHVLDVGCGPGRDLRVFQRHRCVGIDIAAAMVRRVDAQTTAAGVVGDMAEMPFRAGVFDALVCVAALLHIPRELAPRVFTEFARVSAPNARAVVVLRAGSGEMWEEVEYEPSAPRRFFAYYSVPEVAEMAETAGYDLQSVLEFKIRDRRWIGVACRRARAAEAVASP